MVFNDDEGAGTTHLPRFDFKECTMIFIYMKDEELFLSYIGENYEILKKRYINFCKDKHYQWDDDIFADTIIKCHDAIEKKGNLKDNSPQGMENYFFQSFKINLKREKQYSRVAKRDTNLTDIVDELYENYYNGANMTAHEKVKSDLFKDFATLYIMMAVEEEFDAEHMHLFQLKYLCNLTYRQLAQKTRSKGVRQKVLDVKKWLKDNITKEEIKKAFDEQYGKMV